MNTSRLSESDESTRGGFQELKKNAVNATQPLPSPTKLTIQETESFKKLNIK